MVHERPYVKGIINIFQYKVDPRSSYFSYQLLLHEC